MISLKKSFKLCEKTEINTLLNPSVYMETMMLFISKSLGGTLLDGSRPSLNSNSTLTSCGSIHEAFGSKSIYL